jgi:hypothetical protein
MSPDSLDQWNQIVKGDFSDWHPVFHTLTLWFITRIKLSPEMIAISQILALGSAAGWSLSVLQRYGIPRIVLWLTSLLFALLPVNGLMAVTLWKDIPYSVVLLVLAMFLFQIVMDDGRWLSVRRNWVLLGITLLLVSLYRHNGFLPAAATLCTLLLFFPRFWRGLAVAAIIAVVVYGGIKGPVYDILEVDRGNPLSKVIRKLQKDFLFSEGNRQLAMEKPGKEAKEGKPEPDKLALSIKPRDTTVPSPITDRLYSASPVWRILPMTFFHVRFDHVNFWQKMKDDQVVVKYISGNKLGLSEQSKLPGSLDKIYRLFDLSRHNKFLFWMWRPAVYLYILSMVVVLLSWRLRKKLYLVMVPVLFNSLPLFLVVIHKSVFRYHYPLVILALILILPLLFLRPTENTNMSDNQI